MVEEKCMNGHTFPVTREMIDVNKTGTSFMVKCPECGVPKSLTHAKVIELMGFKTNQEARDLKAKMASKKRGEDVETEMPQVPDAPRLRPMGGSRFDQDEDEPEEAEEEEDEEVWTNPTIADSLAGSDNPMLREIAVAERQFRGQSAPQPATPAPAARQVRKHPPIDVMGAAATARDKNDVLRETVDSTNLPDTVKKKVYRFIGLKPEGLSPHELYSVLTYLGVGNAPALAVVRAYEFELSVQQQELDQERQIFNMLGVPAPGAGRSGGSDYPGSYPPFAGQGVSPPGGAQGGPNPFLTATPRASGGFNAPQAPTGSSGSKTEPQIDMATLLPIAMQYPQAFQLLMANPTLMQAVSQNPMMLFQVIQMAGGQSTPAAQKSQPAGMSRDDVKAIVGEEMAEIKRLLTESKGQSREDTLAASIRENQQFMLSFLKDQVAAANVQRADPMAQHQNEIVSVLLNNLLERQNNDNTGVLLQAIDELKKNQTGIGSGSQSIEGMNLFLRYQELANNMEETRRRFQDEREKRESLKDIVGTAAETIGDSIATVIQQGVGGGSPPPGVPGLPPGGASGSGRMRPVARPRQAEDDGEAPVVPNRTSAEQEAAPPGRPPAPVPVEDAPGDDQPAGVRTLACPSCGGAIYVPEGAQAAECPSCHEKFRLTRTPPAQKPPEPAAATEPVETPVAAPDKRARRKAQARGGAPVADAASARS